MMGTRREEKIKERGTITFTPINIRDMESAIKNKEFKTVTDLVNTALRFYFENKHRDDSKALENFFKSEKGVATLEEVMQRVEIMKSKNKSK